MRKRIIAAGFLLFISCVLFGVEYGLSPDSGGEINPWFRFGWYWNERAEANVHFRTGSSTKYTETAAQGFSRSITSIEKSQRLSVNPFLLKILGGSRNTRQGLVFTAGIGLHNDRLQFRETGFIDIPYNQDFEETDDPDEAVRLFFSNARGIVTVKPALVGEFTIAPLQGFLQDFRFSIDGAYTPWMRFWLDHELSSSSSPNLSRLNTPITNEQFDGTSYNSWQVGARSSLNLAGLLLQVEGRAEGAEFKYKMIEFGGSITSEPMHIYIIDTFFSITASLDVLQVRGTYPRIGISWYTMRIEDRGAEGNPVTINRVPGFVIGLGHR